VHIGFHTYSHQQIEKDSLPALTEEVMIDEKYRYLFTEPLIFSYPYLAPDNYRQVNRFIGEKNGAVFFFDTKGFMRQDGNHFFRVCIDSPLALNSRNNAVLILKIQLIRSLFSNVRFLKSTT
jgi:hypothetical protein